MGGGTHGAGPGGGGVNEFARPFRLRLTDGRIWHGVQFPSGHIAVNHPGEDDEPYMMSIAVSMDDLLGERHPEDPLKDALVEWAEGADS